VTSGPAIFERFFHFCYLQQNPREGFSVAHFLTVADIDRSARFYEKIFGGRILSGGDSEGAPAYIQIANTWLLVNVGARADPRQADSNAERPRPAYDQRLCEYARGGYPGLL
jgi:catechol 2,3-dioxygenase-like lactoylglutathione lyase family enzyme